MTHPEAKRRFADIPGLSERDEVALRVLGELGALAVASPPPNAHAGVVPPAADHAFLDHTPLWAYEDPSLAHPLADPAAPPLFETLPPATPLPRVLERTRLVVLLGAADSPTFRRCLQTPGVFILVCESDPARLAAFAASVPAPELARRALLLLGDPDAFLPPLADVLPARLFALGFPVFYALPDVPSASAAKFVELFELLFYRHRLYELGGQSNRRSLPIRPLKRGLFYDQQLHAYANLTAYALSPDIRPLRRAFPGETAVLVAAGPDLEKRLPLVRSLRETCVVIAVNNALKPLVAAGVRPHFVVANDTSLLTARSWAGLPPLPDVSLVAHCLADLGGDVFSRVFLFDSHEPESFGARPTLPLHGSVVTTAFSLARYMGCAACILAGAQLCSPSPWTLSYAAGSIHAGPAAPQRPLTRAFPQLAPAPNPFGLELYTSLNFLDAARWLLDRIRVSGVPCANLTRESILYGPGVTYDPDPDVRPTGRLAERFARLAATPPPRPRLAPALDSARRAAVLWRNLAAALDAVLALDGPGFLAAAAATMDRLDAAGAGYLVQRFADYDNAHMHDLVFGEGAAARHAKGLRYHLEYVRRMAARFSAVLDDQIRRLRVLDAPPSA